MTKQRESLYGEENRRADFGKEQSYLLSENETEVAHGSIPDPGIDPEGEAETMEAIQQWLEGGPLPEDATVIEPDNEV